MCTLRLVINITQTPLHYGEKMSDIFGKLKSGAGKVAHEADKAAHVKRIELDISNLKKQIEGHCQKLGELTYQSKVKNEVESPEAVNIEAKITDLMKQISNKEDEIKRINEEKTEVPTTAAPQTKTCPSCGKENETRVKFCSECGAKLP